MAASSAFFSDDREVCVVAAEHLWGSYVPVLAPWERQRVVAHARRLSCRPPMGATESEACLQFCKNRAGSIEDLVAMLGPRDESASLRPPPTFPQRAAQAAEPEPEPKPELEPEPEPEPELVAPP
eukprot:SAG31_NODE_5365_length_2584_cov_1.362575_2_plen_124_part_01